MCTQNNFDNLCTSQYLLLSLHTEVDEDTMLNTKWAFKHKLVRALVFKVNNGCLVWLVPFGRLLRISFADKRPILCLSTVLKCPFSIES